MTLEELFKDYQSLPEFCDRTLSDVNQISLFGEYPIHIAATRGSVEELSLLLKHGATLNVSGEHGYTPLHEAVEQGNLDAVKWLLENGADRKAKNNDGETAIELARLLNESEIAGLLEAA